LRSDGGFEHLSTQDAPRARPGRLEGKVAVITGAGCVGPGWGNGRAAAVIFAREGARVFAVDVSHEPMAETVVRVEEIGGEIVTIFAT
jgi:NAD(P)-dependent dehydrogenase (short-subunit alcohol dehydrogenase family)